MRLLRQSTSQVVRLGKFVDATDGVTAETALTIANTDILLSKDGGAFAAKNSGGATHDSAGWYSATLDATDTATVGILEIDVSVSGALPVFMSFYVVEEAIYDLLYAASATGQVTPADGSITAAKIASSAFTAAKFASAALPASKFDAANPVPANTTKIDGRDATASTTVQFLSTVGLNGLTQALNLSSAASGLNTVYNTDFANNYDTTNDKFLVRHAGTIQTLDDLDTAQDAQHATTQSTLSTVSSNVSTLVSKLTTGIGTTLVRVLGVLAGKSADASALSDITGTAGGATYNNADDSQEAIGDKVLTTLGTNAPAGWINAAAIGADAITGAKIAAGAIAKGDQLTGLNDLSTAEVNAEVDTAISDASLDTMATRYLGMIELDGAVYRYTINALEQAPAGGGGSGLTQQQVADAALLAPSGTPAAGSQAADLDTLISRTADGVSVSTFQAADADANFKNPIHRGDSYNSTAGNAFTVSQSSWPAAKWESGTTAVFKIKEASGWTETGTVTVSHDGDDTITGSIGFTTAETTALAAIADTEYQVEFTNGSDQRSIYGRWAVRDSDE